MLSMWDSVLAGTTTKPPTRPIPALPGGGGWYAPKTRTQWIHIYTIVSEAHAHHITLSQHSGYLGGLHPNISSKKQQHRDNRCSSLFTHQRSRTSCTRPGSELKVTRERSQNLKRSLEDLQLELRSTEWGGTHPIESRLFRDEKARRNGTCDRTGAPRRTEAKGLSSALAHLVSSDTPQKPKIHLSVGRLSFAS